MRHDNYTLHGIPDQSTRNLLIAYRSLIALSSLIGDSLILIGSLRYNAIKLHKILTVFIRHLAVADLLYAVFTVLPGAVSLGADDWILGEILCYLNYFINDYCGILACLLSAALTLCKLLIIIYPLRAIHFSSKAANLAALCMWAYSAIFPVAAIAKEGGGVFFKYLIYNCDVSYTTWDHVEKSIEEIAAALTVLVPTVVAVVSSIALIVQAKRVANRLRGLQWQGVLTIVMIIAAHLLLSSPLIVFFIASAFIPHSESNANLCNLFRYSCFILQFSVVINFYIYTLTLTSFREFLKSRIKKMTAPLRRYNAESKKEGTVRKMRGE